MSNEYWAPTWSSPESSPRSMNSGLHSDFSNGSTHSSRTSSGVMYIDGRRVEIPTASSHRRHHHHDESERPRRARRASAVIVNTDDIPRLHSGHGHSRNGSHTSNSSHGSSRASRARPSAEPERIYVEHNVGDASPPRQLIYDNRGRSQYRDFEIKVHPASTSRPRRSRSRPSGRYVSSSDEEAPKRRSSMKRPGSRSNRRKSVSFSPDKPEIIDLARGMESIALQNREIDSRPMIPADEPYYRPQVTTKTYIPGDIERRRRRRRREEDKAEEEKLERLRERQNNIPRPPVSTSGRGERRRRNSLVTAPPMFSHAPAYY